MKFKSELQRLRRKFKDGRLLAKESKISVGSISRMLSGKGRPSLKMLYKLAAVVDVETGSRLLAAYLSDQIKGPLRKSVAVCVRDKEGACVCWDPLVLKFYALRPEVRSHVEGIIDELLKPGSQDTPIINLSRRKNRKR